MGKISDMIERNRILQIGVNELRHVEDVMQAMSDASSKLIIYKNKFASSKEFKNIAKEADDQLALARRKLDKIRDVLVKT